MILAKGQSISLNIYNSTPTMGNLLYYAYVTKGWEINSEQH